MSELSPAAQAVLDAFYGEVPPDNEPGGLSVALRAAADQVVPPCGALSEAGTKQLLIRHELLAIATELEADR